MTKKTNLDYNLLPEINSKDIFIRHDKDVEECLSIRSEMRETIERSKSSIQFFVDAKESDDHQRNSALVRAGLNEFYALEDAARRDYKNSGLGKGNVPRIRDSKNPLVHLMYLLRHSNVHATVSTTSTTTTNIISTLGGTERELEITIQYLDGAVLDDIKRCTEAEKFYEHGDLVVMCGWLQKSQMVFGVGEVFRKGVSIYLREILCS